MKSSGEENLQEKIRALSMGDDKLEATLVRLYYRSIQELKESYAAALNSKDKNMMRSIRHKYRTTFHMLGLSVLETEVNSSLYREQPESEEAAEVSIEKVSCLCDEVLSQMGQYYPWLAR